MKKIGLTRRLARQAGVSRAVAADQLDRAVHDILRKLRKGRTVVLPGLGILSPGKKSAIQFEPQELAKGGRGAR